MIQMESTVLKFAFSSFFFSQEFAESDFRVFLYPPLHFFLKQCLIIALQTYEFTLIDFLGCLSGHYKRKKKKKKEEKTLDNMCNLRHRFLCCS